MKVKIIYLEEKNKSEKEMNEISEQFFEFYKGTDERPFIIFTDDIKIIQQNEIIDRLDRIENFLEKIQNQPARAFIVRNDDTQISEND